MQHRYAHIFEETGCDGVLISSYEAVRYLSGFAGFSKQERDAYMLLTEKEIYLFTNSLYYPEVSKACKAITVLKTSGLPDTSQRIRELLKEHQIKKIGYEADNLTVSEWKALCNRYFPNIGISLGKIRQIKNHAEYSSIKRACSVADRALRQIITEIKPGITEQKLQFLLELEIRKSGADVAFPTIIAFGKNAAVPHHHTSSTKLKNHDSILIDFGAAINGYASDMTRTFMIGTPDRSLRTAYHAVLEAQTRAATYIIDLLQKKETIYAADVDSVARDYLIANGFPSIPHALGHGIGLAVHEAPSISPRSTEKLREGMVFSLEPGVYLPDEFGIRIEDLYLIEAGTLQQLTHFPSKLRTL